MGRSNNSKPRQYPVEFLESMDNICKIAVELLDVDHSGVVFFDPDFECGHVLAEFPEIGTKGLPIVVKEIPLEEALLQYKTPQTILDVRSENALGKVHQALNDLCFETMLITPILVDGWVVGSFGIDTYNKGKEFTQIQIDGAKLLADQIGMHLKHIDNLQAALAVASKTDRVSLLDQIVQEAVSLLKAKSGGIYRYFSEYRELKITADVHRPHNIGSTLKLGEGMAGQIIERCLPYMIIHNYNKWVGKAPIYNNAREFGAVLEVPLVWEGAYIGVLYVDDKVGRIFQMDDAMRLRHFAEYAAIALVNAEVTAKATYKSQQLLMLTEATSQIMADLSTIPLGERLNLIAQYATKILNAECCSIFLENRPGFLSLEAKHGHGDGGSPLGFEIEIRSAPKSGLTGHIAYTMEIFNEHGSDLKNHRQSKGIGGTHTPSGECFSLLAIPLKLGEKTCLLRLDNKRGLDGIARPSIRFTDEDIAILRPFADAITVAMEATDLVQDQNRRNRFLADLALSAEELETLETEQDCLDLLAKHACRILEANCALVWSFDKHRKKFIHRKASFAGFSEDSNTSFLQNPPRKNGMSIGVLKRDEPLIIPDVNTPPKEMSQLTRQTLKDEEVASMFAIPVKAGTEPVGILYLYYRTPIKFPEPYLKLVSDFANHAGRFLKQVRIRETAKLTYNLVEEVAKLSVTGDLTETLQLVVDGINRVLDAEPVTLYVYDDEEKGDSRFVPPVTAGEVYNANRQMEEVSLSSPVRQALSKSDLYFVDDVRKDKDWKDTKYGKEEKIVSLVVAPLYAKNIFVGVMFINFRDQRRFTEDELDAIRLFTRLASVAIYGALHFNKLQYTQNLLRTSATIMYLGLASSIVTHGINGRITTIGDILLLLEQDIHRLEPATALLGRVADLQDQIEKIRTQRQLPLPFVAEDVSVPLKEILETRMTQLRVKYQSYGIEFISDFGLDECATISVHPTWFRSAFDVLMENAVQAVRKSERSEKQITVITRRNGTRAEIMVKDNGCGIPKDIQPYILQNAIHKLSEEKGLGAGLMLARIIVEVYSGTLTLNDTNEFGTTFTISLRLEQQLGK